MRYRVAAFAEQLVGRGKAVLLNPVLFSGTRLKPLVLVKGRSVAQRSPSENLEFLQTQVEFWSVLGVPSFPALRAIVADNLGVLSGLGGFRFASGTVHTTRPPQDAPWLGFSGMGLNGYSEIKVSLLGIEVLYERGGRRGSDRLQSIEVGPRHAVATIFAFPIE